MSVVLLLAALAILVGVVVVAVGRGGELAIFRPDLPPQRPVFATGTDVAAFRPPPAFFGYSAPATDSALAQIAQAVAERDAELARLRAQLAQLRGDPEPPQTRWLTPDSAYQDTAYQDSAYRDQSYRDPASRDPASRDPASRDPANRDPAYRDTAPHDPGYHQSAFPEPRLWPGSESGAADDGPALPPGWPGLDDEPEPPDWAAPGQPGWSARVAYGEGESEGHYSPTGHPPPGHAAPDESWDEPADETGDGAGQHG
jgi:hypothetical protein